MIFAMARTNSRQSEILPIASQPRTRGPLSRLARPRCSGPALLKRIGKPARPLKLLAAAAVVAVFAAALALSASSQRLAAQSGEVPTGPEVGVSGEQSVSSVPADAVRLFYNCTEEGASTRYLADGSYRKKYVRVFSSRDQSSCSGYVDGDYILRLEVSLYYKRDPGWPYYSFWQYRISEDIRYYIYVVGEYSWIGPDYNASVVWFDLYADNRKFQPPYGISRCFSESDPYSLEINGNSIAASKSCYVETSLSVYFDSHRIVFEHLDTNNTVLHVTPPRYVSARPPLAQVVRLEVTQGVQDWNNSLTLVRNRRTVVRAFIETAEGKQREITARLKGIKFSADGRSLFVETTKPVNPSQYITVASNVAYSRGDIDASLNFILPEHWTDLESDEDLRLELVFEPGSNHKCEETITHDDIYNRDPDIYNRCVERVEFVEVTPPNIVMLPLSVTNEDGSVSTTSNSMILEQFSRIQSLMPFSSFYHTNIQDVQGKHRRIYIDRILDLIELTSVSKRTTHIRSRTDLLAILQSEDRNSKSVYLGILPGEVIQSDAGCAAENECLPSGMANKIDGSSAIWYVAGLNRSGMIITSISDYPRNIGSHELGHLLGLHHPIRDRNDDNKEGNSYKGVCGERSRAPEVYEHFYIIDYRLLPTLGPLDGDPETEVWGLDTRYVTPISNPFAQSGSSDYAVVNPNNVFSFMSYCQPIGAGALNQGIWMDEYNHEKIISLLSGPNSKYASGSVSGSADMMSDIFSGEILLSSDGSAVGAEFDPVFSRSRPVATVTGDDYVLELRDGNGAVLQSISFGVHHGSEEASQIESRQQQSANSVGFSFVVSNPPEYKSFAIMDGDREINLVNLSDNAPRVSISGITNAQTFGSDSKINLSWTGTDADGDDLSYRIYYSIDGGSSYRLLLFDTENTTLSIDAAELEGSAQSRIGISVSDGFRSSFAETPVFSVAGHPPTVQIESPTAGYVFAESQGFLLDASGYDTEDGLLPSSAFVWTSNIDGNLGTGEFLVLSASYITPGEHTITLTATDSDQMTATATVNITISARNMLPVSNNDEAFGGLEETLLIDVLANDIDTEGDFDLPSLTINRRPRLGIAEIATTEIGRPVIEYSPITGGEDTFTYSICDGLYRCDTAEVTVVFPDCTITGTRGSDNLVGTSGDDVICGLDGDDTIDGKAGNDLIYAGFGEDVVAGRTGDDTIYGGPGNDLILGHRGDDTIYGGLSNDRLYGGGGNDIIYGGVETDELYGEADDDILYGGDGPDKIHSGQGDDTIYGGNGDDTVRGNAGADIVYPGPGSDTVLGASEEDVVF